MISPISPVSPMSRVIGKIPGSSDVLVLKENEEYKEKQERIISELKKRDKEVRVHESSHMRSSELIVISGPQYTYAIGPDGRPYAIGGRVTVSTGLVKNPEDALRKARALRDAALSVEEPSSADFAAASAASMMESEAMSKATSKKMSLSGGKNLINTALQSYERVKTAFRNRFTSQLSRIHLYA